MLLSFAAACRGGEAKVELDDDDEASETDDEPVQARIVGDLPGAGFGAAVALSAAGAWTSAPHGSPARVFTLDPEAGATQLFEAGGRAGLVLATDDSGDLLVGAPLLGDGAILDRNGDPLLEGGGVGRGVAAGPVALDAAGWTDGAGGGGALGARATSIATAAGMLGLGFAHGETSAQLGDTLIAREHAGGGFALAAGDLDGDGVPEWAIGAPQTGVVRIVRATGDPVGTLTGTGRFGAALSMADIDGDGRAELLVGAPRANSDAGEAILYGSDLAERERIAGDPGDRLGTSVALGAGGLLLGAPGGPDGVGAVVWQQD
jgi:hypothetical protein